MINAVRATLEKETRGKCFGTRRYCVDIASPSPITYDEETKIIYKLQGETEKHSSYVDLTDKATAITGEEPLIKYFLDGSRRTYKIDDIIYGDKVFPIMGGQIGVGC